MIRPIQQIVVPELAVAPAPGISGAGKSGVGFGELMKEMVGSVAAGKAESERLTQGFLAGEGVEIHEVVLAQQKAMLQFELLMQTRNKVVQAYQELMRTPL
jgi:flagellar hook-basal body complex protein FliE